MDQFGVRELGQRSGNGTTRFASPDTGTRKGSGPSARETPRRRAEGPVMVEMLRAVDATAALAALALVFFAAQSAHMAEGLQAFLLQRISLKNLFAVGTFLFFWRKTFFFFGLYDTTQHLTDTEELRRVIGACSLASMMLLAAPLVSNTEWFHAWNVVAVWSIAVVIATGARRLLRLRVVSSAASAVRHVIIVGSGPRAVKLYEEICHHPDSDYALVGFVDSNDQITSGVLGQRLLGSIEELDKILMREVVDEVLVALPIKSCYGAIQHTINVCERAGVQASYLADAFQASLAKPRYESPHHNTPVVAMKVVNEDQRTVVKRAIDIIGAVVGLVLLSPVLAAIAIAIKLTSPGPVFYAQVRHGLRRRRFRMLKFRTMVVDAEALQATLESRNEASGPVFKIKDDPRVTRLGRFLRRSSLDELPQLINVLKGDMSLVGPRPLPTRDVSNFDEAWLLRRFSVPQGLTCLWQISGRSNLGFDDWVALDLEYIDRWSLTLDARILMKTIPAVLMGRGAS